VLSYFYDNANRLDYVTDSEGGTRTYEFDNNNQLRARTFDDGTNELRIEYDYNLRGQVEEIRRFDDTAGTTLVSKTLFVYDDGGRVESITHRDGSNALIDDFNYLYDAINRVTQETSHLGPTRDYDYDPTSQKPTQPPRFRRRRPRDQNE
jgi:uncharacterized protein RhaS with RHS repeats